MAITKKKPENKKVRMWRKWKPCALLVRMQNGLAAMEIVWKFFKKLKVELLYDPAILDHI